MQFSFHHRANALTFEVSVIIASIFRIVSVTEIDPEDFSFTNVGGGLWSTVEVEVGFICANLPALRPLVFRLLGFSNSQTGSGATPNYPLSKGGIRSGHIKLQSRGRFNDLDESSTEALNAQQSSTSNKSIPLTEATKTKPSRSNTITRDRNNSSSNKGEPAPLPSSFADIVVQKDFNMSIDHANGSSAGGSVDHFVQITTSKNQVRLPAAANNFYGHRC